MSHIPSNGKGKINVTGSWKVICDEGQTKILWNSLRRIHKDASHLFPKPPAKIMTSKPGPFFTKIYCNTSADCKDETRIRQAADFIRERIDYPFSMQCFDFDQHTRTVGKCIFLHTPKGELYRCNGQVEELVPLSMHIVFYV